MQDAAVVVSANRNRGAAPWSIGPDTCYLKVSAADGHDGLAVFEWVGRSRGGPPLHVHPDQDETFFVREGAYVFQCGEQRHTLGPGDTIFLPRGVPHSFCQLGDTGRLLFLFTPAGDMEAFFTALAGYERPPSPDNGARLFAAHGMTVVGPPIDLS